VSDQIDEANGVVQHLEQVPLGVIQRQRLQLRLPRLLHRGRPERRRRIQLRALSAARGTGGAGSQRFSKDEDGAIFHTYSRYARTNEDLLTAYQLLDLVPKGRDEAGLEWPMQCVRRHDEYG
jgi:hypothetical protein